METTEIKLAAIRASRRAVVLADASKIIWVEFVNAAPLLKSDLLAPVERRIILSSKELRIEILHVEPVAKEVVSQIPGR